MVGAAADSASASRAQLSVRSDVWVFALFACLFALDAPNRGPNGDAHDYFVPVTSLVDHGSLAAPADVSIWDRNLLIGPDGGRYTLFPVGQSVAMLPFYALGRALATLTGAEWSAFAMLNLSSALFAALAVTFVWKTLRALGFRAPIAFATAALYGLGTMIAPYAKVLYSESLQSALVAVLLYFLLAAPRARTLPALAAAFGFLVLVKPIHLALLPVLLYGAFRRDLLRGATRRSLSFAALAVLPFALAFFAWNTLRTGSPFDAYGDAAAHLEQNQLSLAYLPESLRVLFVGATKNLFLFNPVLILAVLGMFCAAPRVPKPFLLAYFAAHVLVFGVFRSATSQGAIAWGPRYTMVFIPALMPLVAASIGWVAARPPRMRVPCVALLCVLGAASLYVQVLGSAYDFFDAKLGLCGPYQVLQKRTPTLPDCDGEQLRTSILFVHHYLLWHVDAERLATGAVGELPWVDQAFQPTLAQQLLAQPRVRTRVLDRNWLLFGASARGSSVLQLLRAGLIAMTLLCAALALRAVQNQGRADA